MVNEVSRSGSLISRSKAWAIPLVAWAVAPLLGLLADCWSDFGATVDEQLYVVGASTAAVISVAVFIELAVVLGALIKDQGNTSGNILLTRAVVRTNAGLFVLSEGAALYAIGSQTSSSLLVCLMLVPMLLQLFLFVECAYHRVGVSRIRQG